MTPAFARIGGNTAVLAALVVSACAPGPSSGRTPDSAADARSRPGAAVMTPGAPPIPGAQPNAVTGSPAPTAPAPSRDTVKRAPTTGTAPVQHLPVRLPPTLPATVEDSTIHRLEQRALALAKQTGCRTDNECATAPVGAKACGGPRYYVVYCRTSTDSTALFKALDELAKRERAYNISHSIGSTCDMIAPPLPRMIGGSCKG